MCTHALFLLSTFLPPAVQGCDGRGDEAFAEPGCSVGQLSEPSTGGEEGEVWV